MEKQVKSQKRVKKNEVGSPWGIFVGTKPMFSLFSFAHDEFTQNAHLKCAQVRCAISN